MKKRAVLFCLLFGLLAGCAPTNPPTAASPTPTRTLTPTAEPTATLPPAISADLQMRAQAGGCIQGITLAGDLAYTGLGPRLAEIDLSQRDQPRLVRQSDPFSGLVTHLLQIPGGAGPRLLVNAGMTLMVVDPSGASLAPIQQLDLQAEISALAWDGQAGIAYAGGSVYESEISGGDTAFISAVSVTPGGELKLMDSVTLPQGMLLSMTLGDGDLFAGLQGAASGLVRIPLINPGEFGTPGLVIASSIEAPLQPTDLQVVGGTLYLSYRGLRMYDITNPDQPAELWGGSLSGGPVIDDFVLAGDQAYVFGWTIQSEFVRGAIQLPQAAAGPPTGETASLTDMHNGDFLVANCDLEVYDTSDPQSLRLVASYLPAVTNAVGAAANDQAVFVLDSGVGDGKSNAILWALSLPDLQPLGQVTTETANAWPGVREGPQWLTVDGDRLYLTDAEQLWIYDVSRMPPALLAKTSLPGGELDVITAFSSDEAHLLAVSQAAEDYHSAVTIYDLSDPQNPVPVGSPLTLAQGYSLGMAWNGSALYVLLDQSYHAKGDLLYDLGFDNDRLSIIETISLDEYTNFMAGGDALVGLVGTQYQMERSRLSMLTSRPLTIEAQIELPGSGTGIAVTGDWLLVTSGGVSGAQLLVYTRLEESDLWQLLALDIPNSDIYQVTILVSGADVILANGHGGVEVFSGSGN